MRVNEIPRLTTLVQDVAWKIHTALSALHRLTNRWQHLGGREADAQMLIISLRETARKLYEEASEIEEHMKSNPTKVATVSPPEHA